MINVSCFHPLIAFPGKITKNGKRQYVPVKKSTTDLYEWFQSKEFISWKQSYSGDDCGAPIMLPCGKCIGCRLDKSREWALRCMMELKENPEASFLTLTYNDGNIPVRYFPDPDTGADIPCYSLSLDDLQRFWKRLRKAFPNNKIRYLASGEYGENSWRPHYHAIVFGFTPPDLQVDFRRENWVYYKSDTIDSIWSNGHVNIASVTFDTCAYVARYTAKKFMTVEDDFFIRHNIEKPFLVMSRRPGIGWSYMEKHKSFFENDKIYVNGSDPVDGVVPRSFIRKLDILDPELYNSIKDQRMFKANVYERAVAISRKVPYEKLLSDAEQNLVSRSRSIKRNDL